MNKYEDQDDLDDIYRRVMAANLAFRMGQLSRTVVEQTLLELQEEGRLLPPVTPKPKFRPRYMMCTVAHTVSGLDISRDDADLAHIYGEDDHNWIGNWVASMLAYIDVRFGKLGARALTPEEVDQFNKRVITVNGSPRNRIQMDEDGYLVSNAGEDD